MSLEDDALRYHRYPQPGKIHVVPSKSVNTQEDLQLAYTPGVAAPCLKISENEESSYLYTSRSNLVAVITNGTAVLGLGNLGPAAAKPVMEGKGVLFKRFADIDVFDLEVATEDPKEFIRTVQLLEPSFGGINLEDIKAPECFEIEETLRKTMNIPIFHDDQHGTAIISGAALLNALEIAKKKIDQVRVVMNGAGAAAIACARLFLRLGLPPENLLLCDSHGVIHTDRDPASLNSFKREFLRTTKAKTLKDALKGADVFVGCSVGGVVTKDMIASMNERPIVFAMANPDPEISYPDAIAVRKDLIMATGRSDFPNQVNNVLGFPFIFRGALDVRARAINEDMKIAAVHALAALAREPVPESVSRAYGHEQFRFGPNYIIPKPFDPRVLLWVAPAVAKAAMESKVARLTIDIDEYQHQLEDHLGRKHTLIRALRTQAAEGFKRHRERFSRVRLVFPEGAHVKTLKACKVLLDGDLIEPILLGHPNTISEMLEKEDITGLKSLKIIDPVHSKYFDVYAKKLYEDHQRNGMTFELATHTMKDPRYFAAMLLREGVVNGYLAGLTNSYPDSIRPLLRVIGIEKGRRLSSVYALLLKDRQIFFGDPSVNVDPTVEELVEITLNTASVAEKFGVEPVIAMLTFSNFGSNANQPEVQKVRRALELLKERHPHLKVDGEMQADTAVSYDIMKEHFPFCTLKEGASVLIFPNLSSANISYKLLQRLGGAEAIGPILVGLKNAAHILQRSADVDEIVNMATVTALDFLKLQTQSER